MPCGNSLPMDCRSVGPRPPPAGGASCPHSMSRRALTPAEVPPALASYSRQGAWRKLPRHGPQQLEIARGGLERDTAAAMSQENVEIVRRAIDAWSRRDLDHALRDL